MHLEQESAESPTNGVATHEVTVVNRWYYPPDLANDMENIDMPKSMKDEVLATAWEYTRCVIPEFTNWSRYLAFARVITIGVICEFSGDMINVAESRKMLGYDVDQVLDALFKGTPGHEAMSREFRAFLLIVADKTSDRRGGELFRRYVNALARSPRQWFRMRDGDALARLTIAGLLACNDMDDVYFSDAQFEILTELADTLYDAVAFFKHRSEGETNSTFAYVPTDLRIHAFHQAREVLWALDTCWAKRPALRGVVNFIRNFGGPLHMVMRRYRFVEESLTIGRPESNKVIDQARRHVKLWNRVDAKNGGKEESSPDVQRYKHLIQNHTQDLMYTELDEFLEHSDDSTCTDCRFRRSYGADNGHIFGGVVLCNRCKVAWGAYLESFPKRTLEAFPELKGFEGFT